MRLEEYFVHLIVWDVNYCCCCYQPWCCVLGKNGKTPSALTAFPSPFSTAMLHNAHRNREMETRPMLTHAKHMPTILRQQSFVWCFPSHLCTQLVFWLAPLFLRFDRSSSETGHRESGFDRSGPVELQREPVGWTQREWQQPVCGTLRFCGQWRQHTQHH